MILALSRSPMLFHPKAFIAYDILAIFIHLPWLSLVAFVGLTPEARSTLK